MQNKPKFCNTCKHYSNKWKDPSLAKCLSPAYGRNLVDGTKKTKFCDISRNSANPELCGPEGRLYEKAV